ncbi:MAG: tetratricopeptide repeat protein [bacterium]|nr:tetratricopeptide repeat protein [bacterium]
MSPRLPWILGLGLLALDLLNASPIVAQPGSVPLGGSKGGDTADKVRRGVMLLEAGDLETAEALFREALEAQPRRPYRVWHLLGRLELLRRDGGKARESFDRALLLAPRFGPALLGRARAAILLGEPDRALEDLGMAAELPATADEASLLAAQVLIYLGRLDDARRVLEELVVDDEPAARMLLAAISTSGIPGAPAGRSLRAELGRHLDLPEAYLALGVFYLQEGDLEQAEPTLRIALEMARHPSMAMLFLERLDGLSAQHGKARSYLPEPDPRWENRWAAILRHAREGRSQEARRASADLLAQRPYYVPARLILIDDAEERDDRWQAMREYQKLLRWLPGLPVLLARRARLAHTMGASALAEQSVAEAIESLPEDGALHHLLASILADTGRGDAALAASKKAIELGFRSSHAYVTLGKIHQSRMQISDAAAAYVKALELDPSVVEILPSSALSALLTEDFTGLEEGLERHLEAHPESVDTLYALALMSLRENELEKSKTYLQGVARLAPNRSEVHYNLGQIHLREGSVGDAQAAIERFRDLKAREDEEFLRHNRAHFLRLEAEQAVAAGETARAIEIYTGFVADGLGEPADYLAVAAAFLRLGDGANAFAWYESVLEAEPYDREALEGLARAAERIQRDEVAERCRERLKLLAP